MKEIETKEELQELARLCCSPCEMESEGKCLEGLDPTKCYISTKTAEAIYNAGYRKERQSEWLVNKSPVDACITCKRCGLTYTEGDPDDYELPNYCPNCGAKMEGGEGYGRL